MQAMPKRSKLVRFTRAFYYRAGQKVPRFYGAHRHPRPPQIAVPSQPAIKGRSAGTLWAHDLGQVAAMDGLTR